MNKIQVGHDSEAFAERDGVGMFPMIGHVGGTKHHPLPVPGGVLSEDNVSIEMAINPTSDIDEFVALTQGVMEEMKAKVEANGCTLVLKATVKFKRGVLDSFAPTSKEQGCDPDFNIYTKSMNAYPDLSESLHRHASGHLHVDCALATSRPKYMDALIKLHDMYVKAPQFLLEGEVKRNEVQGALGNYRPKSYGAEYRSSSNIILTDERILRHAFNGAVRASKDCTRGLSIGNNISKSLRIALAQNDKDKVVYLMNKYDVQEIPV